MSVIERISRGPIRAAGLILGACALVAAGAIGAGCDKHEEAKAEPPPPVEVIVARPVEREVIEYLLYTGTVEAAETVELRARVAGFLEKVNFQPGQRVKAGDVLFEIDRRQYDAAVKQAEATVKAAEAAFLGAQNDARLAQELADQDAGPKIDAIIKAARRDVMEADIDKAKASLAEAKLNLEYCTVTTPIDGRIGKNQVDVGNLVGRGETTLLATVVRTLPVYVSVDVSESDVLKVRRENERRRENVRDVENGKTGPDQWRPTELALADDPDFSIKGRVDYVEPSLNAETGTLRVRTRYENTDEAILPGYFARIRFPMSTRKAMLVPEAALLSDQQGRFALVVNDKNEVEVRRVKIGVLEAPLRVIEDGLTPTDRVITLGVLKVRPGAKVTPKDAPPPPPPPAAPATPSSPSSNPPAPGH